MKRLRLFAFLCIALLAIVGCKKDDPATEKEEQETKPYFYVKYHGDHWATVKFDKLSTMIITDADGKEKSYQIGSRDVVIGPVYEGFTAKMTITAPYDGGNGGSISIARNSDFYFITYDEFSNAKDEETLTYTIKSTTGK